MTQQNKKQLVKVFLLKDNDWKDAGTGNIEFTANDTEITISIKNDIKNILAVVMIKGDAFEKQNERVVQIQGKAFQDEYALSFIDQKLCATLCAAFDKLGVRQIKDDETLDFCEENMQTLRDAALKAMSSRNLKELTTKICLSDVIEGVVETAKSLAVTKKEFVSRLFLFVKALLFIPDEALFDELYNLQMVKAMFVILSYDQQIPPNNFINFYDDFKTRMKQMVEIFGKTEKMAKLIKHAFALVYLRDVVIARFADETIVAAINSRLDKINTQIFDEAVSSKVIEGFVSKYEFSNTTTKRGICIATKRLCGYLGLFPPSAREERAKQLITAGITEVIKYGLNDENKGYCLDVVSILLESGSVVAVSVIEKGVLEEISKTAILSSGSFLYGAFQVLQQAMFVGENGVEYEKVMVSHVVPYVVNILIGPFQSQLKNLTDVSHEDLKGEMKSQEHNEGRAMSLEPKDAVRSDEKSEIKMEERSIIKDEKNEGSVVESTQSKNDEKCELKKREEYVSHFCKFITRLAMLKDDAVKTYIKSSGVLLMLLKELECGNNQKRGNVLRSLRDIIVECGNIEYNTTLVDAGFIEIIKKELDGLGGMTQPVALQVLDIYKDRMSLVPIFEEKKDDKMLLPPLPPITPIKRMADEKEVKKLMEMTSPLKKKVESVLGDNVIPVKMAEEDSSKP
ncbi:hypothetical protein EIN_096450 [Entamoeba invadens IP1]|uniref:Uncharacterized protein n=1 Tax=Entamoeba invadens IP1 TaxID=370355 RepID=A0A0A1U3W9_ENTIV|nr:hypothetical protein EIN_096450 [Entamoeba invadens IP1]ELP87388.1 hypothetical protein EIN_096450 [Entamoeba invadens IP1]|eukprot:XP_004254159.1 hypothetical protein EIN_096450 [Entamoeba invadens IP1]